MPTDTQPPSRSPSAGSRQSCRSSQQSVQSVHVQIPPGILPGEKFFVVIDDMEYEVWAPEGSSAGEMVAMDIYKDEAESQKALTASRESAKRSNTKTSEAESVATDGSLVYVQVPDGCVSGDTFFTDVNGLEYEILVPSTCQSGDLIYLEVPAKRAMGKFAVPENSQAELPYDIPSILTDSENSKGGRLADIRVPTGVSAGQTFVVIIDGVEFEVPVPVKGVALQLTVPDGCKPGELIYVDVPLDGLTMSHSSMLLCCYKVRKGASRRRQRRDRVEPAVLLLGKLNSLCFGGNVPLEQAPVRPESPKAEEGTSVRESAPREGKEEKEAVGTSVEHGIQESSGIEGQREGEALREVLRGEAYRLAISIVCGSKLIAEADTSCACRIKGKDDVEFETGIVPERVSPEWNHEHVIEEYKQGANCASWTSPFFGRKAQEMCCDKGERIVCHDTWVSLDTFGPSLVVLWFFSGPSLVLLDFACSSCCPAFLPSLLRGQILEIELLETLGTSQTVLGSVELVWEQFREGLDGSLSLTGTDGFLQIKIENLGTVAEYVAQRQEEERLEAERLEAQRLEEERLVAEHLAAVAQAKKEAERQRQEALRQQAIEEAPDHHTMQQLRLTNQAPLHSSLT
eukprot:Skav231543  [mRNA]  locus=scaffold84:743484:760351:- [translate_table: standard]